MAEVDEANLTEERNQIKQMQSDIARKEEQVERFKQRKKAFDDELLTRQSELETIREDFRKEQKRAQKLKSGANQRTADAENDFMSNEVRRLLQDRIPAMADQEDAADAADTGIFESKDPGAEATTHAANDQRLHDTVLVSYVNLSGDKREEDYKVSYRIDAATITVEQLLKDACAYWGCSRHDYTLCKIVEDEPQELTKQMDKFLNDEILDPQERSHLHLVRRSDMEAFEAASRRSKKEKDSKKVEASGEGDPDDEGVKLKTLKHGLGNVAAESVTEPFVEALRGWPGVFHLLNNRDRTKDQVKWKRTSLTDFLNYACLILLSCLCVIYRFGFLDKYLLRQGVESTLVHGLPGETANGVDMNLNDVQNVQMYMTWLRGSFEHQLFNQESSLRHFYEPVGELRFRVQKAKKTPCARVEVPSDLQSDCYYSNVFDRDKQRTDDIIVPAEFLPYLEAIESSFEGSFHQWSRSTVATANVHGHIQEMYDGSGYQFWIEMNSATAQNATSFMHNVEKLMPVWLTVDARMLAVELTLANYNAGGYVSVAIILEISPSGATRATAKLLPFHLARTEGDLIASVLDGFRWAIIAPYLAIIRVWMLAENEVVQGNSGLNYVLSFGGFVDSAIIALFVALQYMTWGKSIPPEPQSLPQSKYFAAYSEWATIEDHLYIGEALLLILLITRFTLLLQFDPVIARFSKVFGRTLFVSLCYLAIFAPAAVSTIFLANCIFSPYMELYSTWSKSALSLLSSMQSTVDVRAMQLASPGWAMPYAVYVYMALFAFFINGFVAITTYSYFECELTEHSHPKYNQWSKDQWLDWALQGAIYTRLTGKQPGSSRIVGDVPEDGEDEEVDEEED
eukprot:TRINITY_DN77456_c0_g1_i1.p1 TRINITY_DN77456_c0_g1~~TRINITY_DN77456_c0_g1_i1.p1  ORF type:complete len:854 (-),score=209.75 TRINITY_DN77456_c0_g1_i1:93-2654(-)